MVRIITAPGLERVARMMRRRAMKSPIYDGRETSRNIAILRGCTWHYAPLDARMILSRDEGMHSSGWWKNPDYERCWHLSLSFAHVSPLIGVPEESLPQDHKSAAAICEAIFGEDRRRLWVESPFSDHGRGRDVWHYRLFVDPTWAGSIIPRREVYSRDHTDARWKSWSDLHGADNGDGEFGRTIEGAETRPVPNPAPEEVLPPRTRLILPGLPRPPG